MRRYAPVRTLLVKKEDFEMIRKTIPSFNDFVNETLKKHVTVLQERIHVSISLSAEEKYKRMMQVYPNILQRAPQQHIASFLGITPETLSRVRKQVSVGK